MRCSKGTCSGEEGLRGRRIEDICEATREATDTPVLSNQAKDVLVPAPLRRYGALCAVLAAVTAAEWLLYTARGQLAPAVLPPLLLALTAAKLALVVAWFARPAPGLDWARKALPTALVLAGGAVILLGGLL
jgi:hypothetical protein